MASVDNFKPGVGGQQVSVLGAQQPNIGKNFALGSVPPAPPLTQMAVPNQQQAQIGQGNGPKGAQPVSLMGMPTQGMPILGQNPGIASQPTLGYAPQGQQRMPMAPQMPALQGPPQQKALGSDGEVHTIIVEGHGMDGKKYIAEFDAVFPRGTKVMGVTEKFGG